MFLIISLLRCVAGGVEVIILPAENDFEEIPKLKRSLSFDKGAEVPDSFFEPLPAEELDAWGL